MVAFITIIKAVIKPEGPRKRPIFGKIQFIRLIEMFIETFGALAGFHKAVKETFQLQRELRSTEVHRYPAPSLTLAGRHELAYCKERKRFGIT